MLNPPHTTTPQPQPEASARAFAKFGAVGTADTGERQTDFTALARSAEFRQLRRRVRGFVFPMSGLFLGWYLAYVLAAAYLPGFMGIPIAGEINVGLVMGVGQFTSTALITAAYLKYASRVLDPKVAQLRGETPGARR